MNFQNSFKNLNKSHDNLLQNRPSRRAISIPKGKVNNLNKKSYIYLKPKTSKLNLKRIIRKKDYNNKVGYNIENNSFN